MDPWTFQREWCFGWLLGTLESFEVCLGTLSIFGLTLGHMYRDHSDLGRWHEIWHIPTLKFLQIQALESTIVRCFCWLNLGSHCLHRRIRCAISYGFPASIDIQTSTTLNIWSFLCMVLGRYARLKVIFDSWIFEAWAFGCPCIVGAYSSNQTAYQRSDSS